MKGIVVPDRSEDFAADAVELARELRSAGARVELDVWPGQMHVFQAFARVLPEARRSLEQIAGFLLARVEDAVAAAPTTGALIGDPTAPTVTVTPAVSA